MNTDFYLERGRDHAVCEDFAAAGVKAGQAFALLSDGCSSSKNVDFGAHILVHAARDNLQPILESGSPLDARAFARMTIAKAANVLGCFAALPDSTLDATLLLALVRPGPSSGGFRAQVCFWGDGVVIVRRKDRVVTTLLHFAGNAPLYLSYALNAPRRLAYINRQYGHREILQVTFDLAGKELLREDRQENGTDPLLPYQEQFDLEVGDSLA
ncbi:MAG TPA: protein phosphatase 2C domain-containing protein, partial [Clostridia bacterium]|nr:protein phosphatase 2C domain-containing protein [Clostridia bacterium]